MTKNCEYCGNKFVIQNGHTKQRFCCKSCSVRARHTEDVGLFNTGVDINIQTYIIGLILTDGCITKNNNHLNIVISLKDQYMISMIRDIVCPSKNIYRDGNNYQVKWRNNKDISILKSIGITERKTFSVKFISFEFGMWHFIRGLFDGDGCVYISTTKDKKSKKGYSYTFISFSTASISFAKGLCNFLNNNDIVAHINSDSRDREMYYVRISKKESVKKFANKIYTGCGDWKLIRKYEKLQSSM